MDQPFRILVAPFELKGTLSAVQAAEVIGRGIWTALPEAELELLPLSDGGPGFVDTLVTALRGERRTTRVQGPLGTSVEAQWGIVSTSELGGKTAVVEVAAASGLALLAAEALDARAASSFGTGELICAALDTGCNRILVGLGGSATNDGGAGALEALGVRFVDEGGVKLSPGGAALSRLARIELSGLDPRLKKTELVLATDVVSPLLGPRGASVMFGPQKGADASAVRELETALQHFAGVVKSVLGRDLADLPHMGAAGGLAFGLSALAGGTATSGFALVREVTRLDERLARAERVLTAEGRFDAQTAEGKGPGELARLARAAGKRVVLFAGGLDAAWREAGAGMFDELLILSERAPDLWTRAAEVLEEAASAWARALKRSE